MPGTGPPRVPQTPAPPGCRSRPDGPNPWSTLGARQRRWHRGPALRPGHSGWPPAPISRRRACPPETGGLPDQLVAGFLEGDVEAALSRFEALNREAEPEDRLPRA